MLLNLVPKVFYADINIGLDLFVRCLGFQILYQDHSIFVLERDRAKLYLMQNAHLASQDRPELAIDTDNIDEIYQEVLARAPEMLHPNANVVKQRPWGAKEFAVLDATTVCVVFRQW